MHSFPQIGFLERDNVISSETLENLGIDQIRIELTEKEKE
jgi:hypothetical protein